MSYWDTLDPKYRLILCDIWGVVHDGVTLYPKAAQRLRQWRDQGRYVVLITNARAPPKPSISGSGGLACRAIAGTPSRPAAKRGSRR